MLFLLSPWEGKTNLQSNTAVQYLVEDFKQKGFSRVQGTMILRLRNVISQSNEDLFMKILQNVTQSLCKRHRKAFRKHFFF